MGHKEQKAFQAKPNLKKLIELPVGKFGSMNGNIVYRFQHYLNDKSYWMPGVMIVEVHNHLTLFDANIPEIDTGRWQHAYEPIEHPEKRHCDQAINMIRKMMKDKKLDGLSYVDNLSTLKGYIKDYLNVNKTSK